MPLTQILDSLPETIIDADEKDVGTEKGELELLTEPKELDLLEPISRHDEDDVMLTKSLTSLEEIRSLDKTNISNFRSQLQISEEAPSLVRLHKSGENYTRNYSFCSDHFMDLRYCIPLSVCSGSIWFQKSFYLNMQKNEISCR